MWRMSDAQALIFIATVVVAVAVMLKHGGDGMARFVTGDG
jgi:hypothetical protein